MEHTYRCLLAIGSEELETQIIKLSAVSVIDSDPDIDIITDILNYETVDFVIVNTVLSEEKSLELAKKARERSVKVIAIVESHKNKEFIAALVGCGVKAFVQFDEINKIINFLHSYPEEFDFNKFQDIGKAAGTQSAGIRGKLFGSKLKNSETSNSASKKKNCEIIGVIGTSAGVGATSFCINYSSYLKEQKKSGLLLDRTENKHLSCIEIKGQAIKDCPLSDIDLVKYDFILVDFGHLAAVDITGKVFPGPDMTNEKKIERKYCHEIVLVAPSLPWRLFELTAYMNGIFEHITQDWIFYINGEENTLFHEVKKAYEDKRQFFISAAYDNPYSALDELIENRRS